MLKSDPAVSNWSTAKSACLGLGPGPSAFDPGIFNYFANCLRLNSRDDCRFGQSGGENESCFLPRWIHTRCLSAGQA